jgi:hypothetical protein
MIKGTFAFAVLAYLPSVVVGQYISYSYEYRVNWAAVIACSVIFGIALIVLLAICIHKCIKRQEQAREAEEKAALEQMAQQASSTTVPPALITFTRIDTPPPPSPSPPCQSSGTFSNSAARLSQPIHPSASFISSDFKPSGTGPISMSRADLMALDSTDLKQILTDRDLPTEGVSLKRDYVERIMSACYSHGSRSSDNVPIAPYASPPPAAALPSPPPRPAYSRQDSLNSYSRTTPFGVNQLICGICNDPMGGNTGNQPSAPSCGHTFCTICLNRWVSAEKNCPQCRIFCSVSDLRTLYNL